MIVPLQPTNYYFNNSLTGLINPTLAAPLLLAAAKLGAGKALITPSLTTVIADLQECDFVGYAESATIVWGTPINDADTTPTSISPSHLFRATASTTPNNVQNVFVTDGVASPNQGILASGSFSPPIGINNTGDGFSMLVNWNLGNVPGPLVATIVQ